MTRALVTGGTGFLGKEVVRRLSERGYEVHCTTTGDPGPALYLCDIRFEDQIRPIFRELAPDVVVHCAGAVGNVVEPVIEYYQTNVIGTDNILKAAASLGKRVRFLHISTAGVYGNQVHSILDENLQPLPVQHYSLSKLCAERLVQVRADALDITIIRPFNIVGPGQAPSFIVPKLVQAFAEGRRSVRLGNIDVYRDYIDLDTAADSLVDLISKPKSYGEVVNLCTGVGTSIRQLLAGLSDVAGYEIEVVVGPELVRRDEVWTLLGSREKLDRLLGRTVRMRPIAEVLKNLFGLAQRKDATGASLDG